jgi:predicted ribonuclease YlaK
MKNATTIRNMTSHNGNEVPNQFIITDENGNRFFQSYKTVISKIDKDGKVSLDADKWDFSVTTSKYRNLFLGEDKKATEKKIKSGDYTLTNLN